MPLLRKSVIVGDAAGQPHTTAQVLGLQLAHPEQRRGHGEAEGGFGPNGRHLPLLRRRDPGGLLVPWR